MRTPLGDLVERRRGTWSPQSHPCPGEGNMPSAPGRAGQGLCSICPCYICSWHHIHLPESGFTLLQSPLPWGSCRGGMRLSENPLESLGKLDDPKSSLSVCPCSFSSAQSEKLGRSRQCFGGWNKTSSLSSSHSCSL